MENINGTSYYNSGFPSSETGALDQAYDDFVYSPAVFKPTEDTPSSSSQTAGPPWSDSPESSASSDGSNQHKRKFSNESSGDGNASMADTPMANGILIGADPVPEPGMDDEATNKFMDGIVDFDRAASSPIQNSEMKNGLHQNQGRGISMPVRSVPIVEAANSFTSKSSGSSVSEDFQPCVALTCAKETDQVTNSVHQKRVYR